MSALGQDGPVSGPGRILVKGRSVLGLGTWLLPCPTPTPGQPGYESQLASEVPGDLGVWGSLKLFFSMSPCLVDAATRWLGACEAECQGVSDVPTN